MPERTGRLPLAELVAERRGRLSLSLAAVAKRMGAAADLEGSYSGASRQTIHEIEHGRIPTLMPFAGSPSPSSYPWRGSSRQPGNSV
jgi:transcriptional regulator with XRE-family HTH domain